jgi:polyhydroxyalkanoate synthesis regulator phasin
MDKKLEQLFYAVLGGALAVKEKIESGNEELKAWQEKSEANARTFFDEMAQRGEKEKEQFKGMFKEILKEVVAELDLATKKDLEKLKTELEK